MREFLSRKGVQIEERDFFAQPLSEQELRDLLGERSPREVFASRSPSVKKLGLDPEKLSDEELLRLMLQEPRLIRRPLVRVGHRLIAGASERALEEVL